MSLLPPILVVDDSADDRELTKLVLAGALGPVELEEAPDAVSLARAVVRGRFGLVLTEHDLTWIRSGDVVRLIRDLRPGCPVVVFTRGNVEQAAGEILHLSPDGLLPKTSAGWVGLPQALRRAAEQAGDAARRSLRPQVKARLLARLSPSPRQLGPRWPSTDPRPSRSSAICSPTTSPSPSPRSASSSTCSSARRPAVSTPMRAAGSTRRAAAPRAWTA